MFKRFKNFYQDLNIDRVIFLFATFLMFTIILADFTPLMLWLKVFISIMAFIVAFIVYFYHKIDKSISNVIRDIITGRTAGLYGLVGILIILSMVSWFGDSIFNTINQNEKPSLEVVMKSVNILINIFTFGLVYLIAYPEKKQMKTESLPEKRKILIMALSPLNDRNNQEIRTRYVEQLKNLISQSKVSKVDLEEYLKIHCKKDSNNEICLINWLLPIRTILYHLDTLEEIYFLVSKETDKRWGSFIEIIEEIDKEYKTNLKDILEKNKVREIDPDDHENIIKNLREVLKDIKRKGYTDRDISVNISGGTSAITMCLTIFALEDERQIEYFSQLEKPTKLKRFNLSKDDAIAFLESYAL